MSSFFRYVWYFLLLLLFFVPFVLRCCCLVLRSVLHTCMCVSFVFPCVRVRLWQYIRFIWSCVCVCAWVHVREPHQVMAHKINEVTTTYVDSKSIAMLVDLLENAEVRCEDERIIWSSWTREETHALHTRIQVAAALTTTRNARTHTYAQSSNICYCTDTSSHAHTIQMLPFLSVYSQFVFFFFLLFHPIAHRRWQANFQNGENIYIYLYLWNREIEMHMWNHAQCAEQCVRLTSVHRNFKTHGSIW